VHVIIFEGIATSGKSTLIKMMQQSLKAQVFSEEQTHEPIMQNMASANLPFFKSLLSKIDKQADVVIFDRLYLTQAFRAKIPLIAYTEVEDELLDYSPTTIFLKIDEDTIAARVLKATEHRQTSWGDYIKTKGKTPDEIAKYYIKQQKSQLKLLEQSKLPSKIFDTTNHDYEKIAEEISKFVNI
jgi:thymidylate kinase